MITIRQQIIELLTDKEMDAKQISKAIRIREKEVYDHLDHIAQSVNAKKMKLIIHPSRCQKCAYVFNHRKKFKRPSRCPMCKSTWLEDPIYQIIPN